MTTRQIAPPATLPVTLAEARQALRIDGTAMDAQVTTWLEGIVEELEHRTGRAFINRPCRLTLDALCGDIAFDHPPLAEVTSFKFLDASGVEQTLDPQDYFLDQVSEPGFAMPAPGKTWPTTFCRANAVNIEYIAGYGETPATVPKKARLYILAKLLEQFDPAARPEPDSPQAKFIEGLALSLKVTF